MKKIIAMVVFAFTTLTTSAQDYYYESQHNVTVKAGIGFSSVVGSDADTESVMSYKIGASYDLWISENFLVIPGVELVNKGFKSDVVDGDISMTYLQVPVFAAYKLGLTDTMELTLKAGPYLSYGLVGSDIELYGYGDVNIFDDNGGYQRFDAGVIAGVSLDFNKFMVGVEYSRGLVKLDSNFSQFNQGFGVVLGYRF